LRHIPHVSLPVFMSRLVRRWPALVHGIMQGSREKVRA
jgi:hypothetical protein